MPRAKSDTLTGREAEIMRILWELGPSSAEEILRPDERRSSRFERASRSCACSKRRGTSRTRCGAEPTSFALEVDRRRRIARRCEYCWRGCSAARRKTLFLRLLEDEEISPGELRELAERLKNGAAAIPEVHVCRGTS